MDKEINEVEDSTDKSDSKSQYNPPQLISYGDILELTLTANGQGNQDGGPGKGQKTGA